MTAHGPEEGLLTKEQMRDNIQQSRLGEERQGKEQTPSCMDQGSLNLGGIVLYHSEHPSISQ